MTAHENPLAQGDDACDNDDAARAYQQGFLDLSESSLEESQPPSVDLLAADDHDKSGPPRNDGPARLPTAAERRAFRRGSNGLPRTPAARAKTTRGQLLSLFDFANAASAASAALVAEPPPQPPAISAAVPNVPVALVHEPSRPDGADDSPGDWFTIASGEKAKAQDILAAVRVLKAVEDEKRLATSAERHALGRFGGFGPVALSIFPDPVSGRYKDASWQELGEELRRLLTADEYASAKRTTFNAFYTSPTVIMAMHEALARLGVPGDATLLEPGCGTGNFIRLGRRQRPGLRFIGVELDKISGRIAKALHPGQDIRIENFRDTRVPEGGSGGIDAVIGNVPFADVKLEYQGMKLSLHDFFFAKSIDVSKPGGVLALITSHFTLDKQNAGVREYLAARGDFLGAIRLPAEAFKREGTAVVTDIVFLRKRSLDEPPHQADPEWLGVAPLTIDGVEVSINR